jgi:hypothetical protein
MRIQSVEENFRIPTFRKVDCMTINTLMSNRTFEELSCLRIQLNQELGLSGKLANVMVPWKGAEIGIKQGLYYVGISTLGDRAESENWGMDDCFSQTELSLRERNTTYFRILDALCEGLFGHARSDVLHRIGYSNLFKIHMIDSWSPDAWPREVKERQLKPSLLSLKEEFSALSDCLIYIGSDLGYGVFPEVMDWSEADFAKEGPETLWTRWKWDLQRRNLFVWAYHPSWQNRQGPDKVRQHLDFVVALARRHGIGIG